MHSELCSIFPYDTSVSFSLSAHTDTGGIWEKDRESSREKWWLDWLEAKSYTTLFVDGNHENFDRLYDYPVEEWHGGKVHKIRSSVIHLMRGQVFEIDGKKMANGEL